MQNYKAVIFDFDYTLGDATEGIVSSVNFGLKEMGYKEASKEAIRKTVGLSLTETYKTLTGDLSLVQGERFAAFFIEQADRVMVEHTRLFPDTAEVLEELKKQNIRLAIVTTKFHYRMDAILKKCGADHYFEMIVGREDVANSKPDPEGVLQVLNVFHMDAGHVLYVGDSMVDAETAKRAGVTFAGVTTGTTSREQLQEYAAAGVFSNLSQMIETLV